MTYVEPWLSKEAAETELALRALQATAREPAKLDSAGQPWRLHVAMGDPAENILTLSAHLGCNRIVIGNRGLGIAESLLCGSVTHKVMQHSELPVLVVPLADSSSASSLRPLLGVIDSSMRGFRRPTGERNSPVG